MEVMLTVAVMGTGICKVCLSCVVQWRLTLDLAQVHAKDKPIPRGGNAVWESDALLHRVAELTIGMAGADLANLLNEASILMVRPPAAPWLQNGMCHTFLHRISTVTSARLSRLLGKHIMREAARDENVLEKWDSSALG